MRSRIPFARIAIAATLLGSAVPALADPPHWAPAYGYRHGAHRPHVVRVVPVTYVVPLRAPAVVYSAPIYYAPPAPVAYAYPRYAVNGALAGAVTGAVIGGAVTHGDQRVAGVAVGSVLGAVIGNEITRGW